MDHCAKGDAAPRLLFGGSGIGISTYATETEQRPPGMFLVWATSPQTQYVGLTAPRAGSTPTPALGFYALPDVEKASTIPTARKAQMPNLKSAARAAEL